MKSVSPLAAGSVLGGGFPSALAWETMALFTLSLNWVFFLLPWLQDGNSFLIKNVRLEKCIHASPHDAEKISLVDCHPHSFQHEWTWDVATRAIINWKSGQCLTVHKAEEYAWAQLEPCGDRARQAWACSKKGHLTLQGQGLHLTVKQGGRKAFLSRDKDKFSRWKSATGEIICAADTGVSPVFSDPVKEPGDILLWVPESKPTALAEVHTLATDNATMSAAAILEEESNFTSSLPKNGGTSLEENQKRQSQHKEHQRKASSSRHSGTNWKTVMLVLSLLALALGVIILMLNVHYNKKKRKLPPLKSRQAVREEPPSFPRTVSIIPQTQAPPMPSSSPSPKHGEILIEWKDGTVTPLFDNADYPIC